MPPLNSCRSFRFRRRRCLLRRGRSGAASRAWKASSGGRGIPLIVVEPAVPGFGDDGEGPPVAFHVGRALVNLPGDDGVADDAHAVGVGNHDGAVEEAESSTQVVPVISPYAVEGEPGGEDGVVASLAAEDGWR